MRHNFKNILCLIFGFFLVIFLQNEAKSSEISTKLSSPNYLKVPACTPAFNTNTRITWGNSDTQDASYILEVASDPEFTANTWEIPTTSRYADISFGQSPQQKYFRVKATKIGYIDSDWRIAENYLTIGDPACSDFELISKNNSGEIANASIGPFNIGGNGRFILFESSATNLDQTDTNGTSDIFLKDRLLNTIEIIGKNTGTNNSYSSISEDGKSIAYASMVYNSTAGYNLYQIFLYDTVNKTTTDVIKSFNVNCGYTPHSYYTSLSANGKYLVFGSSCNSLTPGDTGGFDLFINNRETGSITRIAPGTAPIITPNGKFVVFKSTAQNLIPGKTISGEQIYVYNVETNNFSLMSIANDGQPATGTKSEFSISNDGRFVVFSAKYAGNLIPRYINESNQYVFLHDRDTDQDLIFDEESENGSTKTAMISGQFTQDYFPFISPDGKYILKTLQFMSDPTYVTLVDINKFFNDPSYSRLGEKETNGNYNDHHSKITSDDKEIIFVSYSTNLVYPNLTNLTGQLYVKYRKNDVDKDGYYFYEDCNDNDFNVNSWLFELPYNNIDENCNGMSDDDDLDQDGYGIANDCNDNDSAINPAGTEIPYNNSDENCNGMSDDDDLDQDGYGIANDCNDNDSTINPGATETPYNGSDENCNGMTDDIDFDGDGHEYTADCNDNNLTIYPGAVEIPYNVIDDNCNGMADDDDLDHDNFGIATDCNDIVAGINPGAAEIPYNLVDENCNGMGDNDDVDRDGFIASLECNDLDGTIYPGAAEVSRDGIDQDCNSYDLTIEPVATYSKAGKLIVEASSTFKLNPGNSLEVPGSNANLSIDGYGAMSWKTSQNIWTFSQTVATRPATITIRGIEGFKTINVTAQ